MLQTAILWITYVVGIAKISYIVVHAMSVSKVHIGPKKRECITEITDKLCYYVKNAVRKVRGRTT